MALDLQQMRAYQEALQARYAGWWEAIDPEHGKNKMLWMMAELGEAIQIIKRHPTEALMTPGEVRHALVEELADTMMFFQDVLLCYDIAPQEFEAVYRAKHERNMQRWKKPEEAGNCNQQGE